MASAAIAQSGMGKKARQNKELVDTDFGGDISYSHGGCQKIAINLNFLNFAAMEILPHDLQLYLEDHCDPEPSELQKINRETYLKVLQPHMLSGHYQGRLLSMLSKMMQPKRILEIGTFTGYATICLAEGLAEDGIIHTIEVNTRNGRNA